MRYAATAIPGSRFLENLAYLVPGYQGYKDPASRREEDSRFRARLLERLASIRTTLGEYLGAAVGSRENDAARAEAQALRLDGIADAIRYAPYGFSGFFDAPAVGEDVIDRILVSDLTVLQDLDLIEGICLSLDPEQRSSRACAPSICDLIESIDRIERHLIMRDKVLGGS